MLWTHLPSTPGGSLEPDRAVYARLARETDRRTRVESFVVPIRSGRAWPVRAGQLCRIVVIEGPQVADFNCWNLHNPRERFWAARTKQLHRAHLTPYDRLWSCLPSLRPMVTITNDTVQYGGDPDGGRCHDLLGTRCDPYVNKLLTGEEFDFTCHSNLTRAILPFGLTEFDVPRGRPFRAALGAGGRGSARGLPAAGRRGLPARRGAAARMVPAAAVGLRRASWDPAAGVADGHPGMTAEDQGADRGAP